jgi:hypothetical protein
MLDYTLIPARCATGHNAQLWAFDWAIAFGLSCLAWIAKSGPHWSFPPDLAIRLEQTSPQRDLRQQVFPNAIAWVPFNLRAGLPL